MAREGLQGIWLALVATSFALLAVCGSSVAPARAAEDQIDEITWALPGFPNTLLVAHEWNIYNGSIMSLVQEGLLSFDDKLALAPAIAESWQQVDPVTYKYTLRAGVTFQDGSPLTADDVVYTMKWNMNPDSRSQLAAFYAGVKSIEATGDREVTVTLEKPNVLFQYTVAQMAGFIMKKGQLEGNPEGYGTPDVLPVGTGPYKIVEFVPDNRVVLEAYDGYWGGKPTVRKITMTSIVDQQTRLLAMQNGEVDGTFDVSISEIDQWKALDNVDVITAPSLGVYMLTLDQKTPPFNDIHVRRAIAHAVDREGLVKALLKGNGAPAVAINPPEMWTGVMSPEEVRAFYGTLDPYTFDIEKAKAELAQSSVPNGFDVTVPAPNGVPYMIPILLSVSENLKPLGITLNVQQMDDSQWLSTYFAHDKLGMQIMSYFPDFADAANYPYLFFHTANAGKDGMNGSNYSKLKMDELLTAALQKSDPKERAAVLKEAIQLSSQDIAVVPVFWPASAMAINKKYKLQGYTALWYNIPWALRGFGTN